MKKAILILLPLSFLLVDPGLCQEADSAVVIGKGRIVYDGRIYRTNAAYLSIGYGGGYGFRSKIYEQNFNMAVNYSIKSLGMRLGYHASSDLNPLRRSWQKLNDFYFGIGKRWDGNPKWHFSGSLGPSYAFGWYMTVLTDTINNTTKEWSRWFRTVGLVSEFQVTYRPFYDIGIGLSLYGSVNPVYSVAGAQVHLFFSTAYVRKYD